MAEAKMADKGKFILVRWNSQTQIGTKLQTLIKAKCKAEPVIKLGKRDGIALLEFKEEKGVKFLKEQLRDDTFWTLTSITVIEETSKVKITNVPENATPQDMFRFLTNKSMVHNIKYNEKEVEVHDKYFRPQQGCCVVKLTSATEVYRVCKESKDFQPFKKNKLAFEPYYEEIDPVEEEDIPVKTEPIKISVEDGTKLKYLRNFYKEEVEKQFDTICCKLVFLKEGSSRVKIEFNCKHDTERVEHARDWDKEAEKLVTKVFNNIAILRRSFSSQVWNQVKKAIQNNLSDKVWVDDDEESNNLILVGLKDSTELKKLEKALDAIEIPKPIVSKDITGIDTIRVKAFDKLNLKEAVTVKGVEIVVDKSVIRVKGDEESIKKAEKEVLVLLAKILVENSGLKSTDHAQILTTPLMQDKIEAIQDQIGERCGYVIEKDKLTVFAIGGSRIEEFITNINNLVKDERIIIEGKVAEPNAVKEVITSIERHFSPYVILKSEKSADGLIICVVCGTDYLEQVKSQLDQSLGKTMIREEQINLSKHLLEYLNAKYRGKIESKLKKANLPKDVLHMSSNSWNVEGDFDLRSKVKQIVAAEIRNIKTFWKEVELDGIRDYFNNNNGYEFLKKLVQTSECKIRFVTQDEMKRENIHCIVLLETGQAIFVGTGSLTNLNIPVDVVVNAANTKLEHRGGLAGQIVKEAGKAIQDECNAYIQKNGELQPGEVFNGSPGKMPCQRIFHAVGPEWKGGIAGEEAILQNLVDNILDTMSSESEHILQSIAMPLISTGVFGFPKPKAARIMMSTLSKKYQHSKDVREVFFYDLNPDTVRTIQRQMQGIFGNKCYHLPVNDIALGQGTMFNTGTKVDIIKLRSGSRTLPLAGKKKLIVQWGELHKTSADLLVNATHTAPRPSGKTSDGLKQEAGAQFDMVGTCEKAFKDNYQNGIIPDGAMVITNAGRIQNVKKIMHLKIPEKWERGNGRKNLEENIIKCLKEANRLQMTTMAFPTIGTADCNYPGDEVATTFIRSISKFMWEQKSCSLKKIYVVIYKSDYSITSAFECIIEKIYSMRPHRLVANIEETLEEEHKEGETDTTKKPEQNAKQRPLSPVRREPSLYQDKGRKKSQVEGSFNVNATSSAVVELEKGNVENSKADVIVCTTSSFPNLHGAIANAIVKLGGKGLQDECKTKYKTYPSNGVATSGPGNLSCKEVFYVVLSDYNSNNGKDIYEGVFRCLEQAENNQMKSIAMPTFGTGGFKFPDQISSSQTFKAITDFFQIKRQYLSVIVIVMFGRAQHTCQEFLKEAQHVFTLMGAPAPVRTSDTDQKGPQPSSTDAVQLQWKVPNSSITLEITKGNIELAKADVILNTTSSYPHLNGIIPSAISKAAGPQLQQECLTFKGNVTKGMIEETSGYNLNCTKVYHYVMPEWKHNNGEKMIMNCIDDCLYKMKTSGLTSVAIPSIGTGGMKYEPALVARGIYSAVAEFGSKNKDIKCNINVVLFPAATAVNQTFVDELQQFIKDNGSGGKQSKQEKGVRFSSPSRGQNDDYFNDESTQIPTRKRDFVLFELTSDDPKTVEATFKKITDKIKTETRETTIDLKKDNHIDDLDLIKQGKKNKKFLERIGEMYRVNVTFDEKSRKIRVRGLGSNVIKCFERITKFMQDLREQYVSKNLGSIVYQNVEWYYTEDNGHIFVPYPKHISYRLEDAFASQASETEFGDSDDKTYVVDFNKNEEYAKGERDSKTTVGVIRKDTAEGAAHNLPAYWTPMKNENLEEVILKPTEQDYKDTETSFRASIGAFRISQIKEIRRIQNKTLYQQYQTKKEELESKLKNMPNLERILWHGTKDITEKSIISNGFNRSYAGGTFNGKVWYGMGVYFAVKSEYSTGANYSPPDNTGWKRVFLCKVLTGQTKQVVQGYQDRYAPNIPGSNIDRYHSTCDNEANPTEFVIYNDIQAYPEYLIIFN